MQVGLVPDVNAIETVGATNGFTVMVIPELIAVDGFAQTELDVTLQVIISPFANVDDVYVTPVRVLVPFFIHW